MKGKKLLTSMRGGFLSMSKPVMVIVMIACIVLAVVVYIVMLPDEDEGYSQIAGVPMWVKCSNPDCNAEYETDKAIFRESVGELKKQNPMYPGDPPIVCEKCKQQSLLEAVKCPKTECGAVFYRGELGAGHFKDECPKCGYSETKEKRAKSAGGS
ncbi:MAG: hypothetical protein ACYSSP_11995 [Planctomycetota bacterium]|jgi:hypothetical protein